MTPAQEAAVAALDAEYAAIYLYGVIEAYASASRREEIGTYAAAHRSQREAMIAALRSAGVTVPQAAPAYSSPEPITDPISAAKAAAAVEDDVAAAHRNLLEHADDDAMRRIAVGGLGDSAVRGARWRTVLTVDPVTGPFPGTRD